MKREKHNFEKNISRLVKQTGGSDKPSEGFKNFLVADAISQLKQPSSEQHRDGKGMIMPARRILAIAAAVIVACGIVLMVVTPALNKVRYSFTNLAAGPLDSARGGKAQPTTRRKIVYNERGAKHVAGYSKDRERSIVSKNEPESAAKGTTDVFMASKPQVAVDNVSQQVPADLQAARDKRLYFSRSEKQPVIPEELRRVIQPHMSECEVKELAEKLAKQRSTTILYGCRLPQEHAEPGGYPMAHGGTTPPNGEDVDAQFFKNYGVNPFVDTEDDHLSTFATDVDTGSYTVVRKYLHEGHMPPESGVRVEEFVNYFKYGYEAPQEDDFAVYAEGSRWKFGTERKNSYLLRLGLKGKQIADENRKPAVLTFVIDVSGSMKRENRLALVKKALRMLVNNLRSGDEIGIAVYGSRGREVMEHKGLDEKDEILTTIEMLSAGGSTYAEEGIRIGYDMAERAYKKGHINRVILCSDGVANVGQTGADAILEMIKAKADKGITLSAIGFGMGNYNDVLMEQLGDKGNGHYAYVDTLAEAKKLFGENLTGTLEVIARDVKVQVDFNPKVVRSYRLIGYENRDVPDNKFRDDKYDGGEVGAGHSVTALYELKLWPDKDGTVATTYVRYKDAETYAVTEFKSSIAMAELQEDLADCSKDFRLAATAGEFAEILRKSYWAKGATLDSVLKQAQQLTNEFKGDADVIELADLISKAKELMKDSSVKEDTTDEDEYEENLP